MKKYSGSGRRGATMATLVLAATLLVSCASQLPLYFAHNVSNEAVLDVRHAHSKRPSDCLDVCVGMVLQYYGVADAPMDTIMPLDLVTQSRRLNTGASVDEQGHRLYATVLEMNAGDLAAQIGRGRPLIVAFKLPSREEYHSIVVSGYSADRGKFLINDPARLKPSWKRIAHYPTFKESGKYLVLLVGLRKQ